MNVVNTIFILTLAFVAVFVEASFDGLCRLLSAQIDLLPGLMVYASLSSGIVTISLLAVCGAYIWLTGRRAG